MNQTMPSVAACWASRVTGSIRTDVDGAGPRDLLPRFASPSDNSLGYLSIDGTAVRRTRANAADPAYHIAATGDFNGDGRLDIVWTSSQRDLKLWLGNGTTFSSQDVRSYPQGWEVFGA